MTNAPYAPCHAVQATQHVAAHLYGPVSIIRDRDFWKGSRGCTRGRVELGKADFVLENFALYCDGWKGAVIQSRNWIT